MQTGTLSSAVATSQGSKTNTGIRDKQSPSSSACFLELLQTAAEAEHLVASGEQSAGRAVPTNPSTGVATEARRQDGSPIIEQLELLRESPAATGTSSSEYLDGALSPDLIDWLKGLGQALGSNTNISAQDESEPPVESLNLALARVVLGQEAQAYVGTPAIAEDEQVSTGSEMSSPSEEDGVALSVGDPDRAPALAGISSLEQSTPPAATLSMPWEAQSQTDPAVRTVREVAPEVMTVMLRSAGDGVSYSRPALEPTGDSNRSRAPALSASQVGHRPSLPNATRSTANVIRAALTEAPKGQLAGARMGSELHSPASRANSVPRESPDMTGKHAVTSEPQQRDPAIRVHEVQLQGQEGKAATALPSQRLASPVNRSEVEPSQAFTTPTSSGAPFAKESTLVQQSSTSQVRESFIQPHLTSTGFAPAFSARVATMVRDGLETARVHLNPVDMGPVSVQMSLDGQQVRVDMTADLAATRRVLEQALPTLAGALREAGFTLSGGGIHQPTPEPRAAVLQDNAQLANNTSQGSNPSDSFGGTTGGAGGTGGQGQTANPFQQPPQRPGTQAASSVMTIADEGAPAGSGSPDRAAVHRGNRLVDVFA